MIEIVPRIYDDLFELESGATEKKTTTTTTTSVDDGGVVPPKAVVRLTSRNVVSCFAFDNESSNSYAINVWKRIYQKLEGRDVENNKSVSVQEQV